MNRLLRDPDGVLAGAVVTEADGAGVEEEDDDEAAKRVRAASSAKSCEPTFPLGRVQFHAIDSRWLALAGRPCSTIK